MPGRVDAIETAAEPVPPPADGLPDALFVRGLDLPTLSLRQAKAAVAQQLDILSPLPPAQVASSVVLVGPVEDGLNRFAVAFAPRALLTRLAGGGAAVTLTGQLDGQDIPFRFERPGAPGAGGLDWLELATVAGLCLAVLLGGWSVRLSREVGQVEAQTDAANATVQARTRETAALQRVASGWRTSAALQGAALADCGLVDLAKASGGAVTISSLTLADGVLDAKLAAPAADTQTLALKALGLSPVAAPPPAADAPTPAPGPVEFRTSAADCR